jgi:hypothetical protein
VARPPWAPDDKQAKLLAALKRAATDRDKAEATYRELLAKCAEADIPILRLSDELGVERKTIYRHLGRPMK